MAMPCDAASAAVPPAYIVYRDLQPGEPIDPTVPPTFFPPKDSDELFDALRAKYPHLKTHSERMRDAIIEFLLDERQNGQYPTPAALGLDPGPSSYPTAGSHSHSGSSVLSSPEMMNFGTPAYFDHSPMQPMPSQAYAMRQPSISTSSGQPSPPPPMDQMTNVFSLSTGPQPKQRVRRKMTEAEKIEYRKRRIVKACDKCARRKRKCHHNQPEMDSVGHPLSSTLGHKVAKSFASASSAKSSSTTTPPMSQRETESFLGHAFVEATPLDPSLDLPDLPEWAYDDGLFDDELLYPTLDIDEFLRDDIFLPELACHPPAPAGSAPRGLRTALAFLPERANPVRTDAAGLDETGVRAGVSADSRADHVTDERCSSIMKGRTARWKWRQESGPLAGGRSSRNRHGGNRAVRPGRGLRWQPPYQGQHEIPDPSCHGEPCNEPCPDMGSESDGYGSSTSSDQDAIYEALPLDPQGHPGDSRAVPGLGSGPRRLSIATGDRGLSSTSVTVSGGLSSSAAPAGRPTTAVTDAADVAPSSGGTEPIPVPAPRQGPLTTGLLDRVDPKMEIFRLRRRLPSGPTGALARQTRLNTQLGVTAQAALNARLAVIPDALALHTLALPRRTPSGGLREGDAPLPSASGTHTDAHAALAIPGERHVDITQTTFLERLSDHVRYRDHHGRTTPPTPLQRSGDLHGSATPAATLSSSSSSSTLQTLLTTLLILAAALVYLLAAPRVQGPPSSSSSSISWLVLTALTVLPTSKRPPRWGNEVRCTLANSSWLTSSISGKRRLDGVKVSGFIALGKGSWLGEAFSL